MRVVAAAILVLSCAGAAAQTPAHDEATAPSAVATPAPGAEELPARPMTDELGWMTDRLRQAIVADAQRSYEPECSQVLVPDRAMIPIEFTGGGITEYVVPFGRVVCVATGGPGPWQGTGGVLLQFWVGGAGGPPRLVLEQSMHGFTIEERRLITYQHGAYCPGGAGPDICRVTYAWNERDRRLEVTERALLSELQIVPKMEFGYEELSR
jgi:hypothetical protein